MAFVAGQVDAAPHELLAYGARAQTRSDHLQLVLSHLEWRRMDDADRAQLAVWLVERAVGHDSPATLLVLVAEHLRARRVLRVDTLARMITSARSCSPASWRPSAAASSTRCSTPWTGRPAALRSCAAAPRDPASRNCSEVAQYRRLVALGAAEIDVTALPPARRRALEELGRRMTAQQLRRLEPASTSSAARQPVNATSSPSSAASSR